MAEFQIDFLMEGQLSLGKEDGLRVILPLWLIATGGGIAVILVIGLFFAGSYSGVGAGG